MALLWVFSDPVCSVIGTASSSIYQSIPTLYGPDFTVNGLLAIGEIENFISIWDIHAWLQLELECSTRVSQVVVTNRLDGTGERFQNVGIFVGEEAASGGGQLLNMPLCATFGGPSTAGGHHAIECAVDAVGKYVAIQLKTGYREYLQLNEVIVMTGNRLQGKKIGHHQCILTRTLFFPCSNLQRYQ